MKCPCKNFAPTAMIIFGHSDLKNKKYKQIKKTAGKLLHRRLSIKLIYLFS